jgi:AraC-like DNA-binding protein
MMSKVKKMETITQFNTERAQETLHPLVTVLDQSKSKPIQAEQFISELYIIFLKDVKCAELSYGRSRYDYQDETLIFIAPGQLLGFPDSDTTIQPKGWVLAFHPDLIHGTTLGKNIHDYSFFSYDVNEALHISNKERLLVLECFHKIIYELDNTMDKHSKSLIVNNIELFLNYCKRFYDRQFITRHDISNDLLVRFERLLNEYFVSDKPETSGLPTVNYFAKQLHLSPNYFGDLIKKETGRSAQEYIHYKVIDLAKEKVFDTTKSISNVSYELGFKHPAHFTRLFKQMVGQTPSEFRILNGLKN